MSVENDKSKQLQQWSGIKCTTDGTSFLRSNFFTLVVSQLISGAIGIGVFLIAYGAQSERNVQMAARIGGLEAVTARMDDKGTNFSHYNIAADVSRIDRIEARLTTNEEQVKRIAVMDEKLTRIDKTVDEIRSYMNTVKK